MRQRFALVHNRASGTANVPLLDSVLALMARRGAHVQTVAATSAADATARVSQLAHARDVDAVIAAGGDGTIRAVAAGAADGNLPVGIIPLGTGNVMAREIGLSQRAADIAAVLLDGPVFTARGGYVNGAPFFLMAGAGFDGRIIAALNQSTKRVFGRLAYAGPVCKALKAEPDCFDVDIDGDSVQASWVIVSNASRYGGSFRLTGDTQLGADQLVAVVVTGASRAHLIGASLALATGRLATAARRPSYVHVTTCSNVRIGKQKPVAMEIDGDGCGVMSAEISSGGPPLQLIAPASYVADLTKRHTNHLA